MRKKVIFIVAVLVALVGAMVFHSKSSGESVQEDEEVLKPVQVSIVETTVEREGFYYIGIVEPEKFKKLSSKYAGKIQTIHVKKGDLITQGQPLITMETNDRQLEFAAAQADVDVSIAQMTKAKSALEYSDENIKRLKTLFENDALSKQQFDLAVMENQTIKSDYYSAKELVNKAKANQSYKSNVLSDAVIKADIEGHVVEVLYKEGENIDAGYPVVVVRGEAYIMNVGVSQKDISKIDYSTKVNIHIDDQSLSGQVTNIAQVPNEETRAYQVKVLLDVETTQIGAVGKVDFTTGEKSGIMVPINTVFSDQEDFVYIVNDGIVEKKIITLNEVSNKNVYVDGLSLGDQLIVRGMKRVKPDDQVSVVQP